MVNVGNSSAGRIDDGATKEIGDDTVHAMTLVVRIFRSFPLMQADKMTMMIDATIIHANVGIGVVGR